MVTDPESAGSVGVDALSVTSAGSTVEAASITGSDGADGNVELGVSGADAPFTASPEDTPANAVATVASVRASCAPGMAIGSTGVLCDSGSDSGLVLACRSGSGVSDSEVPTPNETS